MSRLRCDVCGQFIADYEFTTGMASRRLVTPDSDYSSEEFETLCHVHNPNHRSALAVQSAAARPQTLSTRSSQPI